MAANFLPYGRHTIEEDDIEAVVDVMRNGLLTAGPKAAEFEKAFASHIGVKEAVVVSNGTTALHLAVIVAGIGPGDVVVVPAITFLSTANVVEMVGAQVAFADVNPETGLMTLDNFKDAIADANGSVKAVMPVHLTGHSEQMAEINTYAKKLGIKVITDCCHALGAEYIGGGKPGDGQFEDFGCYSLHPVKSIAMGEGGVVTTNDPEAAEKMRLMRSHDMHRNEESFLHDEMAMDTSGQANPWYYEMHQLGYNYRATDMQCALGLSQLKKLDSFVGKRRKLALCYDDALKPLGNLIKSNRKSGDCLSAWHLYAVQIDFEAVGVSRATMMKKLSGMGIGTQVHYIPVSSQPYYRKKYGVQNLPGGEEYYSKSLSLPLFPQMEEADIKRVVEALNEVLMS
ncbi:UDP-4-amino-4,6-dideoxy-N-acetyl-beta-L-altrosamine transaminase [Kordiimonas sp. SCSIO 12603]|uniref:UDP-4-amino-4, 6-dideoxy-N-acetyl-beta-L-altrosamine transaminase n=1 Tax=Kordiimonas sp. SCSIO 12603 TaxID=2829596 RepID=UPI0021020100|nr:UDP-4-amino-4,6-dideoxy-N-acetyl-beta-L-altrosamine transaminase [Kordiimonas sp. SCSIO 12603]UTW57618.1 UDP-4-amino-4,6-dideoxy-N-acetyl-beta-L-altrosamine transaminase [Kordiimonas sp. SCSIO 12603]